MDQCALPPAYGDADTERLIDRVCAAESARFPGRRSACEQQAECTTWQPCERATFLLAAQLRTTDQQLCCNVLANASATKPMGELVCRHGLAGVWVTFLPLGLLMGACFLMWIRKLRKRGRFFSSRHPSDFCCGFCCGTAEDEQLLPQLPPTPTPAPTPIPTLWPSAFQQRQQSAAEPGVSRQQQQQQQLAERLLAAASPAGPEQTELAGILADLQVHACACACAYACHVVMFMFMCTACAWHVHGMRTACAY